MKKIFLISIFSLLLSKGSNAQLLNGGFESWNNGVPDNWWGLVMPPYNLFSQTSAAHSGLYAVNLHIDTAFSSVLASPLATGDGNGTTTHTLTSVPGSISFWYRLVSAGGDELTLTAVVYSGGTGVGVAAVAFPAAATYTLVNTPILYGNVPPAVDSIGVIMLISNPTGNVHLGSDAFIDDVALGPFTGIETASEDNIKIFPVPASDQLTVTVPDVSLLHEITLRDANGKEVLTKKDFTSEKATIDISSLQSGIYICNLNYNNSITRKPVIISK